MVHKKSTYRLMFKNYGAEVRKNVWEENNSLRLRRRVEEMSHHSLEEDDSDCDCEDSDDEEQEPLRNNMKNVSVQSQPEMFRQGEPLLQSEQKRGPPNVPRLHFSPEDTPRHQTQVVMDSSTTICKKVEADNSQLPMNDLNTKKSQRDISTEKRGLGVMRSRSQEREYDLIPAAKEESPVRIHPASSSNAKLTRSHKYPYTTQLSRTTKRNFLDRDRKTFLPCGSGEIARSIGDQSSFNIHLNKNQVRHTALQASALRNREIENLIKRQQKLSMDDWRERNNMDYVNNSSIFQDGKQNIFSRSRPKERLINDQHRIRVFSNYCKHCGGRK